MSDLLAQVVQPQEHPITTFIYGLIDPRSGFIRYVGKADKPKRRYYGHLIPSQIKKVNHRTRWLKGLLDAELKPILTILQEVPQSDWQTFERRWIAYFRAIPGYPRLTNRTDGGDGVRGFICPDALKKKRSESRKGITMPPGHAAKISMAHKGRKHTVAARTNMSNGRKEWWEKLPEENRQRVIKNLKTPLRDETRHKMGEGVRNAGHRRKDARSRFRGVSKLTTKHPWRAFYTVNRTTTHIGTFDVEEDAARERDRHVLKYIGERVILNFPRKEYATNPDDIVTVYITSRKPRDYTARYRGVYKNGSNAWSASITYKKVRYTLGTHRTSELAARAYDRKAIEFYGTLALTNFPIADYD